MTQDEVRALLEPPSVEAVAGVVFWHYRSEAHEQMWSLSRGLVACMDGWGLPGGQPTDTPVGPNPTLTLVANFYAGLQGSKREPRVLARGVPVNHSPSRTKFRAAAVARCWKWVLASPTSRACRRPHRRMPCAWVLSIPARGAYCRRNASVVCR